MYDLTLFNTIYNNTTALISLQTDYCQPNATSRVNRFLCRHNSQTHLD